MRTAINGLRQLGELANRSNLKAFREAGAIGDPKGALGIAAALPWLLGRGPSLGVASQMHALALGDKAAIHDRRGTVTWKELDRRGNRVVHAFEQLGVAPRARAATLLRNGRESVEVLLGCQKRGVVACPLNTWAKPRELKAVIANVSPAVLVYATEHADQVKQAAPDDLPLVFVGDPGDALPGSISYEELLAAHSDAPAFPFTRRVGSTKVVIQTSGTTGTPKGAARDSATTGLGALASLLRVVPYRRDDVVVCPAPLFHSFGLATMQFAIGLGATLVLPEKFDPEGTLRLIDEHDATAASLVPVMIRRIVTLPDDVSRRYDLSSLRIVLASGSAMPQDLRRAATDLFGHVLYDLYGSTEAGWVAIATPDDIAKNPRSVGRPSPGIDVAIFGADGERVPVGQTGEIYVRSDILFEGYTSGERKDERDGYMAMGDLGRLDTDGYLYVEARADDMVVVGGENVYPIEVEDVITSLSGVSDAAVLGTDDEEYGKVLVAFVEGSVAPEEVRQACERELASYKLPRRIEIVDELPRTSTGKVLKRELIERLQTGA